MIDDDTIKLDVHFKTLPLTGIKETDDEWLLGQMHVDKRTARGGTSFRSQLGPSSRFYKHATTLDDGKRVVGIILRMCDENVATGRRMIEHLAGWVPSEREPEADRWIGFLNNEIEQRLARASSTT